MLSWPCATLHPSQGVLHSLWHTAVTLWSGLAWPCLGGYEERSGEGLGSWRMGTLVARFRGGAQRLGGLEVRFWMGLGPWPFRLLLASSSCMRHYVQSFWTIPIFWVIIIFCCPRGPRVGLVFITLIKNGTWNRCSITTHSNHTFNR